MKKSVRRGDIYWLINDDDPKGSVQAKTRPCIIVQNDRANTSSMVTIVVVATTKIKEGYPWDVIIMDSGCGLKVPSRIMCNQIFTVTLDELGDKIGKLPGDIMSQVDNALKESLGLVD